MSSPLRSGESYCWPNGTTESARAHEAVAHGRAHLDYQRRIATEGVHRDDARVVRHERKDDRP